MAIETAFQLHTLHNEQSDGWQIEESGTDTYPSMDDAQEAALPLLAAALSRIIQQRLDSGEYIVENGVVIKATEVCCA
jgi:hypothetical protein